MLKHTILNALFAGISQLMSLLAILWLAYYLEPKIFGVLSIQLSVATFLSILLTFQFERVYVRISKGLQEKYFGFHLRFLALVSGLGLILSILLSWGVEFVILAGAMSVAQISQYANAVRGKFSKIWALKLMQATVLVLACAIVYTFGHKTGYWFAFALSYASAMLFIIERRILKQTFTKNLRNDLRRIRYSLKVSALALASMLSAGFTRELPVLTCGLVGRPELAGTIGLIMRIIGAPIGLLAKSASAVVSNFVSSNKFDIISARKLLVVPAINTLIIVIVYIVSNIIPFFETYSGFSLLLLSLAPYFVVRSYHGLMGPFIVARNLQFKELLSNLFLLIISLIMFSLYFFGKLDLSLATLGLSCASLVTSGYVLFLIVGRLTEATN